MPGGQPSQKAFESALALAATGLDPDRVVVVEAESSKVGECRLPPELWKAMGAAPRLNIAAPMAARARYLVTAYGDLVSDGTRLAEVIGRLRRLHASDVIDQWQGMAQQGHFEALAAALMAQHYDPRYEKHRARMGTELEEFATDTLDEPGLDALADRLAARLAQL
jgi:tRNA 2-selenouridine synthase